MQWLTEIFRIKGDVTTAQECARAALIFFYGLILVRIAGRRVFAKSSALDIVVSIVVGSNLSRAATGSAVLFDTLLATTLLLALHWLFAQLAARSPAASHLLEGRAVRITTAGRQNEGNRIGAPFRKPI